MEITFGVNLRYFFWSFLLGGGLSLIYDILRSGRQLSKNSVFRVNLEDGLFFLLAGGLLFLVAFDKNGGQLRWQGFLGTGLGIAAYYMLFQNRVVILLVWLYQLMMRIFLWLIQILLFPVRLVYKILSKPFLVIIWYSKKSMRKAGGILKTKQRKHEHRKRVKKWRKQGNQDKIIVDKQGDLGYNQDM